MAGNLLTRKARTHEHETMQEGPGQALSILKWTDKAGYPPHNDDNNRSIWRNTFLTSPPEPDTTVWCYERVDAPVS